MANVSRKAIAAALLTAVAPPGGPFIINGRRLTKPESAASPGKPALFLIKPNERHRKDVAGEPPERVMRFHVLIFTDVGTDATAVPADVIDDLVDFVEVALAPSFQQQVQFGGRQTLGLDPAVYDCAIDGEPLFAPGDNQGKGQTLIPIKVTLGQYP